MAGQLLTLRSDQGVTEPAAAPAFGVPTFDRALGPVEATCLVVGTVVGTGIFLLPGTVAATVGRFGTGAIFGVWLVSALVMLAGAFTFAELAGTFPRAGGQYLYLREAYGPLTGFLYGWTEFWIIRTGAIAAVAAGFATYAGSFTHLESDWQLRWTAFVAVFLLTLLNYAGVRWGSAAQVLFTATKVALLGALVACAFGMSAGSPHHLHPLWSGAGSPGGLLPALGAALFAVLWSFVGWTNGAIVSEELKDPRRDAPRALILGTGIVGLLYLAVNLAFHYLLPVDRIAGSGRVALDAGSALFGPAGAALAAAVVLIAAFGSVNGLLLGGSRIGFAMARDGLFFPDFARLHPRFRTPANAILFQGLWAGLMIVLPFGSLIQGPGGAVRVPLFESLLGSIQFAAWSFYGLSALAVLVLRVRRPELERPFRVPGYPVVPGLFALVSFAMTLHAAAHHPGQALFGLAVILLGLPAYLAFRRTRRA